MSYSVLEAYINARVYPNGNNEITGQLNQDALNQIVDTIAGFKYGGVITSTSTFSQDADHKWWFIASEDGTYSNHGGDVVSKEVAIFKYDGSFTKEKVMNYYLPDFPNDASFVFLGDGTFGTLSTPPNSYTAQAFTSQTSITVTHNFGAYPVVQVLFADGKVTHPFEIQNNSVNDFTVTFSSAQSGTILATIGTTPKTITTVNTATYDLLATDDIVHVTRTATGACEITIPTAQLVAARRVIIKDTGLAGTNNITILTEGAETIDGDASWLIDDNYDWLELYSDGINWFIIG